MRFQGWWIEQGLLASGNDPTAAISHAADQFGDEYVPMVFMSGDGHRTPPFQWSNRGAWAGFFTDAVQDDKVCCHVETYADAVSAASVPGHLAQVYTNHKVFGWEPEVYKTIQRILEAIPELIVGLQMGTDPPASDIRSITRDMWLVHDMGHLRAEGAAAMRFWDMARATRRDPVPRASLPDFQTFLRDYNRTAMQLRTGINNEIGANIQKVIDRFPDHLHLVTCGDAHIIHNPLYRYITPPVGTFGIADQTQN